MGPTNRDSEPPAADYEELVRLAERAMAGERGDHTLQATALAHEAWLRLVRDQGSTAAPAPFAFRAARAMRQVLIEHARARATLKRSADRRETLGLEPEAPERDAYLIALNDALADLGAMDAQLGQIVELRFFGGHTVEETARIVGVSPRTVKRAWAVARGWLHQAIADGAAR